MIKEWVMRDIIVKDGDIGRAIDLTLNKVKSLIDQMIPIGNYGQTEDIISLKDLNKLKESLK